MKINTKTILCIIFIISLLFSLSFLMLLKNIGPTEHAIPGTDYLNCYKPMTENIINGTGIILEKGFYVRCAPGYPLFLTPIFSLANIFNLNYLPLIILFNTVITAFNACLLFIIVKKIFILSLYLSNYDGKKIAFISSILWTFYPFNLWLIKNPNTEIPFILLLFISIWLFLNSIQKKWILLIFLTGIIIGFSALVRPIGLFLPLIFIPFTFLLLKENYKKYLKGTVLTLVLLFGFLSAILPWSLYASFQTDRFVPISSIGADSTAIGLKYAISTNNKSNAKPNISPNLKNLMERANNTDLTTIGNIINFSLNEFKTNHLTFSKLIGLKIIRSWYGTSQMWWENTIILIQAPYLLLAVFGIFLAFKKFKDNISYIIFLLSFVLYFWLMTISSLSILRYMLPIMTFVLIFSAISINYILSKIIKDYENLLKDYEK